MTDRIGQDDRRWVVAAYQRIRQQRRAYSMDQLMAAIPPPAGRSASDLANMLDKVVALRRLKKAPARWELSGGVTVRQPNPPQADLLADPLPTSPEAVGLPAQKTPRPQFALGPWRAGAGHLESGPLYGTWPELLRAVTDALSDGYIDRLVLIVEQRDLQDPIRVVALRGLDPLPFFLAYTRVSSGQQSRNLAALNWHLWRPEQSLSYDNPELALVAPVDVTAVATWRTDTPFNLARAVCHSLHLLCGTARPAGVVEVVRADSGRRNELSSIEEAKRLCARQLRANSKPVRGHCRACGHALRDAASLRRGYGPDCWERVTDHRRVGLELAPDLPAHYWAGALPISGLRKRIREDVARELRA